MVPFESKSQFPDTYIKAADRARKKTFLPLFPSVKKVAFSTERLSSIIIYCSIFARSGLFLSYLPVWHGTFWHEIFHCNLWGFGYFDFAIVGILIKDILAKDISTIH